MEIKSGSYRTAIIFPRIGLVIKIPRIYLVSYLRSYRYYIKHLGWKHGLLHLLEGLAHGSDIMGSMRHALFKGFLDNWKEWIYYVKTRHPFVVPTICSFFGIFNVQPLVSPFWDDFSRVTRRYMELIDEEEFGDYHHFLVQDNYGFYRGTLRMIDYGYYRTQEFLNQHRRLLSTEFRDFKPI